MPRRSPLKPVNDELQEAADAGIHQYRASTKAVLDAALERALCDQIASGNIAVRDLKDKTALSLRAYARRCDLSPLSVDDFLSLIEPVILRQLERSSGPKSSRVDFASALANCLHQAVADVLGNLPSNRALDSGRWLADRMPIDDVINAIPPDLVELTNLWNAVELRESAINELVESHLKLAAPFALKASRQPFEFDDLMNEAYFILRRAAVSFNPTSGNRFSSYAGAALHRELSRRSPSRIGVKRQTANQLKQFDDAKRALSQEHRRLPCDEEVYEKLACTERTRTEIENVRRILAAQRGCQKVGELPRDWADSVLDDPSVEASDREEALLLRTALEELETFEKTVVIEKCISELSFRQMAKKHRRSASTLRDIFGQALAKLSRRINSNLKSRKPR